MPRVTRKIRWFRKDNEQLAGEADLHGITLRQLRQLFGCPADDPMYDCAPVTQAHVSKLQPHVVGHHIRLDRYEYFVEADAGTSRARAAVPRHRSVA